MTDLDLNAAVARKLWYKTAKGKEYTRNYRKANAAKHAAYKRAAREKYAKLYPEKVLARNLVGDAVRNGYMTPPEFSRNWHNRWEFHHPDHSRPYYGVWLSVKDHNAVEKGKMDCPPCTDYSESIKTALLQKWGFLKLPGSERRNS